MKTLSMRMLMVIALLLIMVVGITSVNAQEPVEENGTKPAEEVQPVETVVAPVVEEVAQPIEEVAQPVEEVVAEPKAAAQPDDGAVREAVEENAAEPIEGSVEPIEQAMEASSEVSDSALPGSGWWTSATIQNVGTGVATLKFTVYDAASNSTFDRSLTVAKDGQKVFMPNSSADGTAADGVFGTSTALTSGFNGSAVIESDQPVVAIGQVGNNKVGDLGVTGGMGSAAYRAGTGAAKIFYPTVKANWGKKTTTLYIQAAGADATIVATYKTNDGTSRTFNATITANKQRLISPEDFTPKPDTAACGTAVATSQCMGAVTVVASSGTIVGAVVEAPATGTAIETQAASLFNDNDANTTIYCPVYKVNYAGRDSGITVQNVSGAAQDISFEATVALGPDAGTGKPAYTSKATAVADGASVTFYPFSKNDGSVPEKNYSAVKLTAGGKIVAAVNESNNMRGASQVKSATYACFNPAQATTKVALPQVKEVFGGVKALTGVSVQNVSSTKASVTAVYNCSGTSYAMAAVSVDAGKGTTYYNLSSPTSTYTKIPEKSLCSVNLTADQPIVAIANEAGTGIDNKTYEGFNLQ